MGADLICFIAKGPRKFSKRTIQRAVRHAKQLQKKANELYDLMEEIEAADDTKKTGFVEKAEKLYDNRAFSGVRCQVGLDDLNQFHEDGYLCTMTEEDVEKRVKDFVQWWYTCEGRDTAGRQDPDNPKKKIVVCGEMSWGDKPDGYGYGMMDRAYWFEIPESLGIV